MDVLEARREKLPLAERAPFPWFGGKSTVADAIWERLGTVRAYLEPFCGSAAMLLRAPTPASLEVIGDADRYIANFWRSVRYQPDELAAHADYPVSHLDLDARHRWLTQPDRWRALDDALRDPEWPGDARIAGWWVWGLCAWIGSGWCHREVAGSGGKIPQVANGGKGIQSKIPHVADAGRGIQSQIPHVGNAGRGLQSDRDGDRGERIRAWMRALSRRLEDVRVMHGGWERSLNMSYAGEDKTAIFFDPPYKTFESLYSTGQHTAAAVEEWCRARPHIRIALCGHVGDYDLPGWTVATWTRVGLSYGGDATTDLEAVWFSPACMPARKVQQLLPGV